MNLAAVELQSGSVRECIKLCGTVIDETYVLSRDETEAELLIGDDEIMTLLIKTYLRRCRAYLNLSRYVLTNNHYVMIPHMSELKD
jgi:hypothetical protein